MEQLTLQQYLLRNGGVVSISELRERYSRRVLSAALQGGVLVRLRHTLVALPGLDRARAEAIRHGGLVSHLTAARAHGWKVKRPPARPTITVPSSRKVRSASTARIHYAPLTVPRAGAVTDKLTTVIDCSRALPFDEALCVADSALRSGDLTREDLIRAAEVSPRTGRARALRVAHHADGKAANPFESVLRAIALEATDFAAVAQCPVAGVGHADVGDPNLRIALEAESFEFHAVKEAFNYDIRRYTDMSRRGWLVARFLWDDVMHRSPYVRETVIDLMALRESGQ